MQVLTYNEKNMTFQSCILACIVSKKVPPLAFFSKLFCQAVFTSLTKNPNKLSQIFLKAIHFQKNVVPKLRDTYFTLKYVISKA